VLPVASCQLARHSTLEVLSLKICCVHIIRATNIHEQTGYHSCAVQHKFSATPELQLFCKYI
jgi:hypothetical protein